MEGGNNLFLEERRSQIVTLVNTQHSASVEELSTHFKVSPATIRSDLNYLDGINALKRTHGGAIPVDSPEENTSYKIRKDLHNSEKKLIALRAFQEIKNGSSIALDASSTCFELAKLILDSDLKITVVTNGLNTASILKENLRLNVIILGGFVRGDSNSIEGSLGIELLNKLHIDQFFFSAYGVSLNQGLSDFNFQEIELKKSMLSRSTTKIALIDNSKYDNNSTSQFARFEEIDKVITDNKLSTELFNKYSQQVRLIRASKD